MRLLFIRNSYIKGLLVTGFFLFVLCLFLTRSVLATEETELQGISLAEAVEWGLEHNSNLMQLKDSLIQFEHDLDILEANLNWKMDLSGTVSYGTMRNQNIGIDEDGGQQRVILSGSKNSLQGLVIQPEFSINNNSLLKDNNLEDKLDFNLSLRQNIYPKVPTELEQQYYNLTFNQKKALDNLEWQQQNMVIEWIEGYLEILRNKKQIQLTANNLKLAKGNYEDVLKQQEIGEAGQQKVLAALIDLKKGEINLVQARNNYYTRIGEWKQKLGLPEEMNVLFVEDTNFLSEVRELNREGISTVKLDELMEMVINSNYQLKANRLDIEKAEQEFNWKKAAQQPEIYAAGSYNYQDEEWTIGLNLSYNLLDGGLKKLETKEYQKQINSLQKDYQELVNSTRLQLSSLLKQHQQYKLTLEEKSLSLEKARLEEEYFYQQLQQGLITESEYEQRIIISKQTLNDLETARDQLFINELRIKQFIGLFNLNRGDQSEE